MNISCISCSKVIFKTAWIMSFGPSTMRTNLVIDILLLVVPFVFLLCELLLIVPCR